MTRGLQGCCTRRRFIGGMLASVPVLSGCANDQGIAPASPRTDVTVTDRQVVIRLAAGSDLAVPGSALAISWAQVIVLYTAAGEFRAFSNVCTHAGCGITDYREQRMRCRCHGSEFDEEGINVAGPAPAPLTRLPLTVSVGSGWTELTVDR
jgi:Rieske Fe-S protein